MTIRQRRLGAGQRPLFTKEDVWFLAELPVLTTVATVVPERHWSAVCIRLEHMKAALGRFSPEMIRRGLRLFDGAIDSPEAAFAVAAMRSEHHLQILRDFLWGWSAPVDLVGAERVSEALAKGRGAVLWVAHFSFNALATKRAFHAAGFPVSHLSRPEHGFSKSRFGIRWLNPIRVRTELRYLAGRVIIDRARPTFAVRQAHKLLADNQIVSVTAGAWEGARVATVEVGGCALDLSTGAPGLALMSGAMLLPVFTIRDDDTRRIRVVVDEPVAPVEAGSRDDALLAMTREFADRLLPYVKAHPLQWRDWEKLRPPAPQASMSN